jgi:hypothetical protein
MKNVFCLRIDAATSILYTQFSIIHCKLQWIAGWGRVFVFALSAAFPQRLSG